MAKAYLGIDIGSDSVKLALVRGGKVRRTAVEPMPAGLFREGRITSTEAMGELLREIQKRHRIHANLAALSLPGEAAFVRTTAMHVMTADQLSYNLPYEFNDYITDELRSYAFDYAMISTPEEILKAAAESDSEEGGMMELMAVATPMAVLDEARDYLRKAGLQLAKAAPAECAYIGLIRAANAHRGAEAPTEYCILDLGHRGIRMYMFQGDRHMVTRELERGINALDEVVAENLDVDVQEAHRRLMENRDDCQNQPWCVNAYGSIAVELMRSMNFYRFSNPDSHLADVWLCGGGAKIAPLREVIAETLNMQIHPAAELAPGGESAEDAAVTLQAVGAALE